jgi:hypothetical protein
MPELGPGHGLHELVQGAEPAGQHDEAIRQVGHGRLSLVHRVHHLERGQALVGDLLVLEGARDHTVHLPALLQDSVCEEAHQPDVTTSVDEADLALDQQPSERRGSEPEVGIDARARRAVHAEGRELL